LFYRKRKISFQAKLATTFAPSVVKLNKIFDLNERKYHDSGLHFRHTDNINYFMTAAKVVGLPKVRAKSYFLSQLISWDWFARPIFGEKLQN
jgi:hypothetical protein